MLLNKEQVKKVIPHRDPFLFIDEVETVVIPNPDIKKENFKDLVGTEVIAWFEVKDDMPILGGHFPGNPILPGVIQVEMMAQSAAFASLGMNGLKIDGVNVDTLLLGAEACKFRKPIGPGMKLKVTSYLEKTRGPVVQYDCKVFHNDEIMGQSKILAKLIVHKGESK